jgi:transcriptional regulator with XRE-family HTH domain
MSGLSQAYINQLESGRRKFTQKTLTAIADALGLPLSKFFEEEVKEKKIQERIEPSVRRPAASEIFKVLKALPSHVADHYMTLMSIEKDLYDKKKAGSARGL